MPDNIALDSGSGGKNLATAQMTFSGDTADFQITCPAILGGGPEGSWSQTPILGGAGAVAAGVQRMVLATDDPAVTALEIIDDAVAAEGAALGSGILIQGDDGTDRTNVLVDTQGHLQVDVLSAASTAVTNAGTFAVQVDGAALTALQIMDDWDESDRAKVNLIAGQAGITANAGAVGASTPRVTLASNDPAVAKLGTIDTDTGNIVTAVQVMDDWDESDRAKVNPIAGQAGVQGAAGAVTALTQRVTLASDDPAVALLAVIDDPIKILGTDVYSEASTKGVVAGAVRNDDLAALANTDNEVAPLQVNSAGALYTEPAQQVDYVFDGSDKATIQRKTVIAATGTVEVIAAPTGTKKIRVLALMLHATSATVTNVYFRTDSNAAILFDATNNLKLAVDVDADNVAQFTLDWNPGGWFETQNADEALDIVLSAAQDVVICITWIEVD